MNVDIRAKINMPTKYGNSQLITFNGIEDKREHLAISFSDSSLDRPINISIQSDNISDETMKSFAATKGIILYLGPKQNDLSSNKYNIDYAIVAQMLNCMNVSKVNFLNQNLEEISQLKKHGVLVNSNKSIDLLEKTHESESFFKTYRPITNKQQLKKGMISILANAYYT